MWVTYEGPSPARVLDGIGNVERGGCKEVPDALGEELVKSKSWTEAKPPRSGEPKPGPAPDPKTKKEG